MDKLERINNVVTRILVIDPETRDDDNKLYLAVIEDVMPNGTQKSIEDIFLNMKKYKIPPFESVSRARRKVQELRKDLRGTGETQDARKQEEFNFWNYYRS